MRRWREGKCWPQDLKGPVPGGVPGSLTLLLSKVSHGSPLVITERKKQGEESLNGPSFFRCGPFFSNLTFKDLRVLCIPDSGDNY